MEDINLILAPLNQASNKASTQDVLMKQAFGLVFKEILNSLITSNEAAEDGFKTQEDKEVENSFLNNDIGQQILNQIYEQYILSSNIDNLESVGDKK